MLWKTCLISSCVLLSGCWHTVKPEPVVPAPQVIHEYVYQDCGTPPARDTIELRPIFWQVQKGMFSLTANEYEDLSYNISQITLGVAQLKNEIKFYEQCLAENPDVE